MHYCNDSNKDILHTWTIDYTLPSCAKKSFVRAASARGQKDCWENEFSNFFLYAFIFQAFCFMKEVPNYGGSGRSRVVTVVEYLSGAGEIQ